MIAISDNKFKPNPKIKRIAIPRNSKAWEKLVEQLFIRDGYRCKYCKHIFPAKELCPMHEKSVGSGGDDTLENMSTGCLSCHTKEHAGNFIKQAVKTYKIFD